jgi:hypothetical protein
MKIKLVGAKHLRYPFFKETLQQHVISGSHAVEE